jgi:hypothetical protein
MAEYWYIPLVFVLVMAALVFFFMWWDNRMDKKRSHAILGAGGYAQKTEKPDDDGLCVRVAELESEMAVNKAGKYGLHQVGNYRWAVVCNGLVNIYQTSDLLALQRAIDSRNSPYNAIFGGPPFPNSATVNPALMAEFLRTQCPNTVEMVFGKPNPPKGKK